MLIFLCRRLLYCTNQRTTLQTERRHPQISQNFALKSAVVLEFSIFWCHFEVGNKKNLGEIFIVVLFMFPLDFAMLG